MTMLDNGSTATHSSSVPEESRVDLSLPPTLLGYVYPALLRRRDPFERLLALKWATNSSTKANHP